MQISDTTIQGKANVRDSRYCEIFDIKGNLTNLNAIVYNTLGCNDCPDEIRRSVDPRKLKDSLKAKSIAMNGPRVFMMDRTGQNNTPRPKVNLAGIEMIERATVPVSIKNCCVGNPLPTGKT
jgi:haloalkane dehalogenase